MLIYGASGHGHELAQLAKTCGHFVIGHIDDDSSLWPTVLKLEEAKQKYPHASVLLGVGSPKIRRYLASKIKTIGFEFFSGLVHPKVEISSSIHLGQSVTISAGCVLTVDIHIGDQTQIDVGCTISHDVWIDDYVMVCPGVHISGNVKVESDVFIGAGVVIMNGTPKNPIVIGKGAVIGAGACVTKSVPPGETWVGVPAGPIKRKQ